MWMDVCVCGCVRVVVAVVVGGKSPVLFVEWIVRIVDRTCKCGILQRETAARLHSHYNADVRLSDMRLYERSCFCGTATCMSEARGEGGARQPHCDVHAPVTASSSYTA